MNNLLIKLVITIDQISMQLIKNALNKLSISSSSNDE